MRIFVFILVLLAMSCSKDLTMSNAGDDCSDKLLKGKAIVCLKSWLSGADNGGYWEVIYQPFGSNLQPLLIGDNPCLDKSEFKCGVTQLRYIVGDDCCRDTAIVSPIKCCLNGISNCN